MNNFQLTFYTDINAFEIYKCLEDSTLPDLEHKYHEGSEWTFEWDDTLTINWIPEDQSKQHYVRFIRGSHQRHHPLNETPVNPEKPDKKETGDAFFLLDQNHKITFVKSLNDVAHWAFDFCWGEEYPSPNFKVIDPEAKIRGIGH